MKIQWTRKAIEFNKFTLSYLEGGKDAGGYPILFLPGWGVSTEPYREYLALLAEKYWVIAPDLPGFGRSPSSSLTGYQTYANCIVQLVERLNLDRFRLIGHSFGGAVALALAATIPQAIDSLIIISSTGVPIALTSAIARRFTQIREQITQLGWTPLLKVVKALGHNLIFRSRHLITAGQIALQEDIRPWLSEIKAPCLVLWGEKDSFLNGKLWRASRTKFWENRRFSRQRPEGTLHSMKCCVAHGTKDLSACDPQSEAEHGDASSPFSFAQDRKGKAFRLCEARTPMAFRRSSNGESASRIGASAPLCIASHHQNSAIVWQKQFPLLDYRLS